MEIFQYLVNPYVHLGIIVFCNLLRAFKVITCFWWIVNIPTILIIIFYVYLIVAVIRALFRL